MEAAILPICSHRLVMSVTDSYQVDEDLSLQQTLKHIMHRYLRKIRDRMMTGSKVESVKCDTLIEC